VVSKMIFFFDLKCILLKQSSGIGRPPIWTGWMPLRVKINFEVVFMGLQTLVMTDQAPLTVPGSPNVPVAPNNEGLRIFGKIVCAVAAVAATVAAVIAASAIFPGLAAMATAAFAAIPLPFLASIGVGSIIAAALSLFGVERLGRESGLDDASAPPPGSTSENVLEEGITNTPPAGNEEPPATTLEYENPVE
jgi:hypothetical protein